MKIQKYKLRIKDISKEERPRERLVKNKPKSLSNAELLAIILKCGSKKESVIDLSRRILSENTLASLSRKRINTLKKINGIGEAKACEIVACFELGRRLSSCKKHKKKEVRNAQDLAKKFLPEMSTLKKEHFKCVFLDSRKKIINHETIFIGTMNTSIIHPREIFQAALEENAAGVIFIHNHPSGNPEPSEEDIEVTRELKKAGEILGISVLDHIIMGNNNYLSLRDRGYL